MLLPFVIVGYSHKKGEKHSKDDGLVSARV